VLGQKTA